MEDNATDLGSVLNDQPVNTEPPAVLAPAEPVDQGVIQAEPPAAKQPEPDHVPRAALQDERRKRQELEQRLAIFEQQQAQRQQPTQQQDQQPKPLNPNDFESYEAFLRAEARAAAREEAQREREEERRQHRQREAFQATFEAVDPMVADGKAKYADFEQVVGNPHVPITDSMMTLLTVVDGGHDVAYHLGKNPHEADRIARMTPAAQGREIRSLAKQLAAPAPAPAPAAPPLPKTLTQTRSAGGQFSAGRPAYDGPTPLNAILGK